MKVMFYNVFASPCGYRYRGVGDRTRELSEKRARKLARMGYRALYRLAVTRKPKP